tara:strand:- start:78 stop:287 length:210 start_codon:yes stop_codon:yes gene_type:complete
LTEREGLRPKNIGTRWGEMGQYRTKFVIPGGFVTLLVTPKNDLNIVSFRIIFILRSILIQVIDRVRKNY